MEGGLGGAAWAALMMCERAGMLLSVCILCRACLRVCFCMLSGLYFLASNVSRAHFVPLLTACARVRERGVPVGHDDDFFVLRERHHDTQMMCSSLISAVRFPCRATVRPRRSEQTKEILSRISWYEYSKCASKKLIEIAGRFR